MNFVIGVDVNPADKHEPFFYVSVARLLAETAGSVSPTDFEGDHMKDMITAAIPVNATPYATDQVDPWVGWKIMPAQIVFALKVQGACAKKAAPVPTATPETAKTSNEFAGMAEAVKQFAELQAQALQKR